MNFMMKNSTQKTLPMIAVVKEQPTIGFSLVRTTISTDLAPDEVLIQVSTASFCGTDTHIYEYNPWAQSRLHLPLIVGHELSGTIIKLGKKVTTLKIGDCVSAESHITCGTCEFCLRGEGHICENTKIIGVDTQGCFANYVKIPAKNCYVLPSHFNPKLLSVLEPLGNAVHTMTHFEVKDKAVAIVGCGPIGIMGVDVVLALGARKVIAIEVKAYRRELAAKIGAHVVIDPLQEDVVQRILDETGGKGVDVVGEFSGNVGAINQAFKYIKAGGGMSLLGLPSKPIEIDLSHQIIYKGLRLYGVTGRRLPETWNQVFSLLPCLHLDQIITHELPFRQVNEAGELMRSGQCGKIILIPEEVTHE